MFHDAIVTADPSLDMQGQLCCKHTDGWGYGESPICYLHQFNPFLHDLLGSCSDPNKKRTRSTQRILIVRSAWRKRSVIFFENVIKNASKENVHYL